MTNTKLREQVNKALDFFTEPGQGEKYLKDLEDELLTLFRTTLQEIVPTRFPATEKQTARTEAWDLAINTINANIKDILGEE